MRQYFFVLIIAVVVYILCAGVSFAIFSQNTPSDLKSVPAPTTSATGEVSFDQTLPKTEMCPLNGAMYSKQQKKWWDEHRPLGVMIENHEEARPQSGLSFADVIYEAVAEGGITRFLAIFYCEDAGIIGPIRSARTYFLDWISEYGEYPLYTHVGGANCNQTTGSGCQNGGKADALGQIRQYGWQAYNALSQFNIGYPDFYQDRNRLGHEVATEHTMYSKSVTLWRIAKERGLTSVDKEGVSWDKAFVPYEFKEDAPSGDRSQMQTIHLEFWEGYKDYTVDWTFDKATNVYKRANGGKPHLDRNTDQQIGAKNIVILLMQESSANDGYDDNAHLLYRNKGTGKAVVFMDGKRIDGKWRKDSRTERTLLYDGIGNQIVFNKGSIWFEILPLEGVVEVK